MSIRLANYAGAYGAIMPDVVIAFSRRDLEVAEKVCQALEGAGVRCSLAHSDIEPNSNCVRASLKAVDRSRVVLLIFTANTNLSNISVLRYAAERGVSAFRGTNSTGTIRHPNSCICANRVASIPCNGLHKTVLPREWLCSMARCITSIDSTAPAQALDVADRNICWSHRSCVRRWGSFQQTGSRGDYCSCGYFNKLVLDWAGCL